jgi:hypothetical protein
MENNRTTAMQAKEYNEDLFVIQNVRDKAIEMITNEVNFLNYYETDLKEKTRLELACFQNNGALFNLILNVYSIYEFTVKRMLIYTLEIIDKEKIKVKDLIINLRGLFFKENINLIKQKLNESSVHSKEMTKSNIIKLYELIEEDKEFVSSESMIDTKSNLKFEVLSEIISYFDFNIDDFKRFKPYITSLVHYRNNVAHGNLEFTDNLPPRMMPINEANYNKVCEEIIEVIKCVYIEIDDYINNGKYKY